MGPYSSLLKLEPKEVAVFNKEAIVFFHHLNLPYLIYQSKESLPKEMERYTRWVEGMVRPWIESNGNLRCVWYMLRQRFDLYDEDFIDWLGKRLNLHDFPSVCPSQR